MDPTHEWQLLRAVAPSFLELASFYIGGSEQAVKARTDINIVERGRDPFYAKLKTQLEELASFIEEWEDGSNPPSFHAIRQVLKMFENRASVICKQQKKSNGKTYIVDQSVPYKNLNNLVERIQRKKHDGTILPVQDLLRLVKLTEKKKQKRDDIIRRLETCNHAFRNSVDTAQRNNVDSDVPDLLYRSKAVRNNVRIYSDERRRLMDRVYDLLSSHWKETELNLPDAHLLLDPHPDWEGSIDAELNFWLLIKAQDPQKLWQYADLFVHQGGWAAEASNVPQAQSKKHKEKQIKPEDFDSGPWDIGKDGLDLEDLIWRIAQSKPPRRLNLVIKENMLKWENRNHTSNSNLTTQKFWPFESILADGSSSVLFQHSLKTRFVLAFVVASSFLQMCGGPWSRNWSKEQIFFANDSLSTEYDISRPCLAVRFSDSRKEESAEDIFKKRTRLHDYPEILALGIMLIQIFLGKPIEAYRTSDNPNTKDPNKYEIDADITVAERMFESAEWRRYNNGWYDQAVKACLNTVHFTRGKSLSNEKFRQQIYKDIVWRIELVVMSYGYIPSGKAPWHSLLDTPPTARVSTTDQPLKNNRIASNNISISQMHVRGSEVEATNISILTTSSGELTDHWMKNLESHVHSLLYKDVNGNQVLFANRILDSECTVLKTRPVRIAILDTGIKLPKSAHLKFGSRVKGYKDWVSNNEENRSWIDDDGHGTHTAALLLKVAPHAEVYVARVFRGKNNEGEKEIPFETVNRWIAEAIIHAVDRWEVDIISMSWGFSASPSEINSAILYAYSKNVLMFAAVGNSGGNSPLNFPARSNNVIGINAADGLGNKAPFTANSRSYADNFILPGVDVESSWPSDLGQGLKMRASGTSCATPMAAALAADILEIAGLQLWRSQQTEQVDQDEIDNWKKLKTVGGMRAAFRLMSSKRDGYDNIQPQGFFPPGPPGYRKIETAMEVLFRNLTNEA